MSIARRALLPTTNVTWAGNRSHFIPRAKTKMPNKKQNQSAQIDHTRRTQQTKQTAGSPHGDGKAEAIGRTMTRRGGEEVITGPGVWRPVRSPSNRRRQTHWSELWIFARAGGRHLWSAGGS